MVLKSTKNRGVSGHSKMGFVGTNNVYEMQLKNDKLILFFKHFPLLQTVSLVTSPQLCNLLL